MKGLDHQTLAIAYIKYSEADVFHRASVIGVTIITFDLLPSLL